MRALLKLTVLMLVLVGCRAEAPQQKQALSQPILLAPAILTADQLELTHLFVMHCARVLTTGNRDLESQLYGTVRGLGHDRAHTGRHFKRIRREHEEECRTWALRPHGQLHFEHHLIVNHF